MALARRAFVLLAAALAALPAVLATPGAGAAQAAPSAGEAAPPIIVLVRHAEKAAAPADDPPLTEEGRARAMLLASMLESAGVTAVLSSDYERTRATAGPVAETAGVGVELYDPRDGAELARALRGRTGVVVVVGHSNTVPGLVTALGGDPGAAIADDEYDRLYVVHPAADGTATTLLLRFGS